MSTPKRPEATWTIRCFWYARSGSASPPSPVPMNVPEAATALAIASWALSEIAP